MPSLPIFGGANAWNPTQWTAVDDRVRGGSSKSTLECTSNACDIAVFSGYLDTETLGGAGFASQRTTAKDLGLDLSTYDGIVLEIAKADRSCYTLILKDQVSASNPENGREQAVISWEYDFRTHIPEELDDTILIPIEWREFEPTYRGKKVEDAKPLNLGNITRMSIMNRSFFNQQQGSFSLSLKSVAAYKDETFPTKIETPFPYPYQDAPNYAISEKQDILTQESCSSPSRSWFSTFCGLCLR